MNGDSKANSAATKSYILFSSFTAISNVGIIF